MKTRRVAPNTPSSLLHGFSIDDVKQWRATEDGAGRPTGLEDFYRAHGLCVHCRANGQLLIGIHWKDAQGVEQNDSLGTDEAPVTISDLLRIHQLDKNQSCWNYLWENCEICGGSGKVNDSMIG